MADTGQEENPGTRWTNFNPSFLAFIIVCGLLSTLFLNYFNRVFASAISYLIRLYTWHRHKIWIDIQALQVSLLAGRIFFTGFRYHGNNETILIQNGYITWSYWLWRVKDVDLTMPETANPDGNADTENPAEKKDKSSRLPCRINIAVSGLEWFIYNRTPVYESILTGMTDAIDLDEQNAGELEKEHSHPRQRLQKASQRVEEQLNKLDSTMSANKRGSETSNEGKNAADGRQLRAARSTSLTDRDSDTPNRNDEIPLMLQLLPVHFECDRAAVVMGNGNTKGVLIIKTKSLSGEIDASGCETPDPYRQMFKIQFEHPVVEMRDNEKYQEDQLARTNKEKQTVLSSSPAKHRPFFRRHRRKVLNKLRDMIPYWRRSVESFSVHSRNGTATAENHLPGSNHWQGLSRYLNDDEEDDKLRWSSVEYAAVNTILDSPEAVLTIFWDVPGKVTQAHFAVSEPSYESNDINGVIAPAWAINLSIGGGVINYGPWADRLRADLQKVFNPSLSKDATAARKLQIDADRIPTQFKLYLEIDKEVTLRIPTREDSKNWRWKKEAAELRQHQKQERRQGKKGSKENPSSAAAQQRPYGWLDVKVGPNATVSYTMDMMANSSGYRTSLDIELPSTEISTSINHGTLWKSGAQHISCDLSNPLKWNGLRNWRFDIKGDDLELFILRDHIFLLIDLIDDWGSGPVQDYLLFVPFKYFLNFQFRNLRLYLNVNDVNIVNNPTEMEDNTYLVLSTPLLKADTCISLDSYRPSKNAVPFNVQTDSLDLALHLPTWNTQAAFLTSNDVGHLESLGLDGSYHYNATTSPSNTDTLVLNASGQSLVVTLHGFIIRYFLQLKDNYFGDHIHFQTLEEYQEMLRLKTGNPDAEAATRPPHKKSNDMDVVLSVRADDPRLVLPANLYTAKRHINIEAAGLAADLRFTNYYMDLDLNVSPLSLSLGNDESGAVSPMSATSSTQMYIDGLGIYGHRLFGLPPTEPTYLCNWDLSVGAVTGECTTDFLTSLANGGKAFGFSLDDDENALIPYSSVVMYDVTFLRVLVHSIQVWLHVDEAAFLFSTQQIDVNFNDWARSHYSKRANIKIPDFQIACVNSESAARHKSRLHGRVETDALLKTSIHFALIGRKPDFTEARKLQQELVRREDQRTRRTEFLLLPGILGSYAPESVDVPAQSVPTVPQPVVLDHDSAEKNTISSSGSAHSKQRSLRHKSSFLSFSTDSNGSILRPGSVKSSRRATDIGLNASTPRLQPQEVRPVLQSRDHSTSTGHLSPFRTVQAGQSVRGDLSHNTVAFSSQFFAPYFPLDSVRPGTKEAMLRSMEQEDDEIPDTMRFGLEDIDPELLGQGSAYSSFLIELPAGVTTCLNTTSLQYIAALLGALQPTEPEDILDNLQIGTMSDIFDEQKQKKINGSIKDFVVRIPQANLRFLNCSKLDSPDPSQEAQDQYDFAINGLALAARTEDLHPEPGLHDEKARSSFHFRLDSVEMSAAERLADSTGSHAAVEASLEHILVSMASKDVAYIDGDIGTFRTTSSSDRIDYLAALIHRTNTLVSQTGSLFTSVSSKDSQRLQHLTYHLMKESQLVADPTFIVRPSATLRAASEHLRTYDSWKMMSRLRQVWVVSSRKTKDQLRLDYLGSDLTCPVDARQGVTAAFQKWRNWDLDDIDDSTLVNLIFGNSATTTHPTRDAIPLMAVVRLQEAAFVLDPGPKQNQICIADITTRVHSRMTKLAETHQATGDVSGPLTVVNTYCAQAGIDLNWGLLELAEDILQLYNRADSPVKQHNPTQDNRPPSQSIGSEQPSSVQVVFVLGQGNISLETVNLKSDIQSDNLKISALVATREGLVDSNVILACDTVTTRLRSHQQHLSTLRLKGPSVFISHELQLVNFTSIHTAKATASSEALKLVVKQDPIMLSEVLDTVVRDELAQLYQLKHQLPAGKNPEPQKSKISERLSSIRGNLVMFLNSYTITVPLLRSLTYTIEGVVARASMAANLGKEIIFDFDIKENSHNMQIRINNELRSISVLQIPPTNGRITSQMGQEEHSVTVFASLELVQLDASAVYSLLTALNRPEMSNAINDLQQQGKMLQEHVKEIFGPPAKIQEAPITTDKKKLIYIIHTTLAGIEIFGHAPIKSDTEPMAHLSFCLASIHLELANRLEPHGPVLENPEVHINLRQIMFDIQKGANEESMRTCGNLSFGALITATTKELEDGTDRRSFDFLSDGLQVNLSADTISTLVDVLGYMGDKIKDLDTMKEIEYLQKRLRQTRPRISINDQEEEDTNSDIFDSLLASISYSFEITNIEFCWLVAPGSESAANREDLVLSFQRIEFATRKSNTAKLTIENFQLQMVPSGQDKVQRSHNSALLPEVVFNVAFVSTIDTRRLAFQAVGKSLDLRLTSGFIVPAANIIDSIGLSASNARKASAQWTSIVVAEKPAARPVEKRQRSLFGSKRLESCLVDADFAGAVVNLSDRKLIEANKGSVLSRAHRPTLAGKYGQFAADDSGSNTVLRTPGLAWKLEYRDDGKEDSAVYGELKVDASRNILYPTVVPLIMDITSSIKEVVSDHGKHPTSPASMGSKSSHSSKAKAPEEDNILTVDPSAVLGRTKLNIGLRIRKQEFTLSCQPIARVAATTCFDDIYITVNTVHSIEHGNFFAISGTFSKLQTSVQHVYSREHTGRFEVDSIVLSLMNSKHVSGTSGVSAILKVSPMKIDINAKQLQDFLLFREIWLPRGLRQDTEAPVSTPTAESTQGHLVQRYQQVAATAAFPWTATVSIASLDANVDLGQSLGKSVFVISEFWMSSKKTSDWEQNLCLGFQKIGVDCVGRLGGYVALQNFKLRTSIEWPEREAALNVTPRIQASIGFSQFRLKAAFDYQAFLFADITSMEFLMYNVRRGREGNGDRLVAVFDGEAVQIFGITTSAASGIALWQAVQKLIQERKAQYETSLRDIEKFMKRKSIATHGGLYSPSSIKPSVSTTVAKSPISLDTDVVVTLKALNLGVFSGTFSDDRIFKLEALNAQARFAASMQHRRIHSILGLTLGQLRIGLANVRRLSAPKTVSELSVEDVVTSATGSRGGTILKVPKVEAIMQTWQMPESRSIDYIFKSAFEGKVEVGWNYARIGYIRSMWATHSKQLARTLGRELPGVSAIKVTGVPEPSTAEDGSGGNKDKQAQQAKITAEVNVPQSKYEYVALEPPIIETPQLKDMGEATPPLEWIGLHRERLPNLTHQIVIVSLLELAGEVEDAYESILGSS